MKQLNKLQKIQINTNSVKQVVTCTISSGTSYVIGILKWRRSHYTVKMRRKRKQQDLCLLMCWTRQCACSIRICRLLPRKYGNSFRTREILLQLPSGRKYGLNFMKIGRASCRERE